MSDFVAKLDEARQKLPLRRLMEQYNRAPSNGKWNAFPECPFCKKKGGAGVFNGDRGVELFKCHHASCETGGQAFDEVGFLQFELHSNDRREAAIAYLKLAGVWKERDATPPSVMPGKSARKHPVPKGGEENEDLVQEALAWINPKPKEGEAPSPLATVSVRGLMKQLNLGYSRAVSVINELERRKVVSAAGENGVRTVLPVPAEVPASSTAETKPAEVADSSSATTVAPATPGDAQSVAGPGIQTPSPSGTTTAGSTPLAGDGDSISKDEKPPDNIIVFDGGKGGGGAGGKPPGDEPPPLPPHLVALAWFYSRLELSDKDWTHLFEDRGLTDATIKFSGVRSNPQANKEILLEMPKHFPMQVLLDSGLWKIDYDKVSEPPKPNAQYYGMSVVEKRDAKGKKVRDQDGDIITECVWNNPILIPYFNERGELVHLRPHKGMMKDRAPLVYVVRAAKEESGSQKPEVRSAQFAIITEGEFKALALWQVIGDMAAVMALPGITMAKPLFADVEEWVESTGVRQVVVGYDNEEKGDPKYAGYQEDKWKRFDSQAWARYLARQLTKQGYDGKVCVLPDQWRDEYGKADWDGRLSQIVRQSPLFKIANKSSEEIWTSVKSKARAEFLVAIRGAMAPLEIWQGGFFDREEERIIKNKLENISYEPCMPIGGDDEAAISRRLKRLAMRLKKSDWFPVKLNGFLFMLAHAYTAVNGRYFKMKPLTERQDLEWQSNLIIARSRSDEDAKRAIEMVLRGKKSMNTLGHIPKAVSDFYLKPQYCLNRINGTRSRMVTMHNVHGLNTGLLSLPSKDFATPVEMRRWLQDSSTGGAWDGGQNELTALHEDFGHVLVFKDVMEVPLRGYHEKSKIWFWEDVAFSEEGEFRPDKKTGIFWIRTKAGTQGYSFARDSSGRARDREDEVFRQGVPKMFPDKVDSESDARDFFKEVMTKLVDTLGGFEAYMALGMVCASAAGPEIFKEWSAFPGLWVHGQQGEGKSSVVRWLIRIWGFIKEKGLPLPSDERGTLTAAALAGALGQYGEIPLWLDEYQPTAPSWVRAILKNSYDRAEGGKKDFGASPREFLAGVIVSGIATSTEPQTKSRFAHIQVSAKNRKANHYHWFQTNSHQFHRIGKFLMRNRSKYVTSALEAMKAWVSSASMKDVDDRARMVHGLAYAGFHAACEVFDVEYSGKDYWTWLVEHCRSSAAEVQESVSVDLFWREVLTALESDAFGETPADRRRVFNVQEDKMAVSPVSELQTKHGGSHGYTAWKSYLLYFQPGPVIEMLRKEKRKTGRDMAIQQSDLLNQMKVQPYFVQHKTKFGHRQKFNGENKLCWCIRVDAHELGLMKISDEDFNASLVKAPGLGTFLMSADWMDPRKGDLFGLIASLESKQTGQSDK